MDIQILLILLMFGFLAAFIDSVVGGGGLISIPALLATGMPPSMALGTNKLASSFGSFTSAISFIRSRKVDIKFVAKLFPISFLMSIGGALVATKLPPEYLKPLAIIMLSLVLIYTLFKKNWGEISTYKKLPIKKLILFIAVIGLIGFYDGFLGGGTGSFLLFVFLMIGFDFLKAAGNAKVLNFASNLGALLLFIVFGQVNFTYGLSMGVAMIVGSYAGSQFAIRKGVSYVKVLFICVTVLLIGKNIYDYFKEYL